MDTQKEIVALTDAASLKAVERRIARARQLLRSIVPQLETLLTRIPKQQDRAIMERYLIDFDTPAEIADASGTSPQNVRQRLEGVMKLWKQRFGNHDAEDSTDSKDKKTLNKC